MYKCTKYPYVLTLKALEKKVCYSQAFFPSTTHTKYLQHCKLQYKISGFSMLLNK